MSKAKKKAKKKALPVIEVDWPNSEAHAERKAAERNAASKKEADPVKAFAAKLIEGMRAEEKVLRAAARRDGKGGDYESAMHDVGVANGLETAIEIVRSAMSECD